MTMEEIEQEFNLIQQEVTELKEEIEKDAHLEFINSLKQFVVKY